MLVPLGRDAICRPSVRPSADVPLSKGGEKLRGEKFGLGNGMGGERNERVCDGWLLSLPPSLPPSLPGMDAPTFCVCAMPLGLMAFAGQKSVLKWYKLSSLSVYF